MLDKTNFTTRTDLHPEELAALIKVRAALETGEIKARRFKMDTIWEKNNSSNKCGSVGCIGGWAGHFMGLDPHQTESWMGGWNIDEARSDRYRTTPPTTKFHNLFYPNDVIMAYAKPQDGAQAITNFLMGSNTPWDFMAMAAVKIALSTIDRLLTPAR